MGNSPVLELIILLSFTYFIGSLLLSAIYEAIAGAFRLSPRGLKFALENLLFGNDWKPFVKNQLAKSPHIQSLMKSAGRYPAYIPAKSFVHAIVEQFRKAQSQPDDVTETSVKVEYKGGELSKSIGSKKLLIPYCLKEILLDFAVQVEAKHESAKQILEFEKKVEEFYDSSMDRAGGWYKRKTRGMLLLLALGLCVFLNIDSIKIATDALADKQKLNNAVDNISARMPDYQKLNSVSITDSSMVFKSDLAATGDNLKIIKLQYNQTTGYTFGYTDFWNEWKNDFWKKLIGIFVTVFALQLGSNFWFDLMNKAVNIRAAGKRPDEKRPPQDIVK